MNRRLVILGAAAGLMIPGSARAHQFLDYFEYGRVELSPRGYRTAAEVAASARHGGAYRVVIHGHIDAAEAAELSEELSRRRAQSMATELFQLGLEPARFQLIGHGARQLARVTPEGVAEPLNRRITVDLYLV